MKILDRFTEDPNNLCVQLKNDDEDAVIQVLNSPKLMNAFYDDVQFHSLFATPLRWQYCAKLITNNHENSYGIARKVIDEFMGSKEINDPELLLKCIGAKTVLLLKYIDISAKTVIGFSQNDDEFIILAKYCTFSETLNTKYATNELIIQVMLNKHFRHEDMYPQDLVDSINELKEFNGFTELTDELCHVAKDHTFLGKTPNDKILYKRAKTNTKALTLMDEIEFYGYETTWNELNKKINQMQAILDEQYSEKVFIENGMINHILKHTQDFLMTRTILEYMNTKKANNIEHRIKHEVTPEQKQIAARVRVNADRVRNVKTPQWIHELAKNSK